MVPFLTSGVEEGVIEAGLRSVSDGFRSGTDGISFSRAGGILQSVSEAFPPSVVGRSRVPVLISSLVFPPVCENMRCIREDIVFFSCIFKGEAVPDAKADPGKDSSPEPETSDPGIG